MRDIRLSKPVPRVFEKAQQRKAKAAHRREVYRLVDFRDEKRCRYCRKRLRQTLECVPDRLEHHHLTFRSRGGQDESCNLVTLCLEHHIEAQQHRLLILGNPDEELVFRRVD